MKMLGDVLKSDDATPDEISLDDRRPSCIGRLYLGLSHCFEQLGIEATDQQLEGWAILIHESMSVSSRNYHNVEHIFDITKGWDDPIGVLAAYFHDTIYFAVDGSLSVRQTTILHDIFEEEEDIDESDELLSMCSTIFGIYDKREMRNNNEFLSCVTAFRELENVLDKPTLAKIGCCIEGTIPFRPISEDGKTPEDLLYDNIKLASKIFDLKMDEDEIVETIQKSVLLANRDVGNFGEDDRKGFLDVSWSLLPEINKELREVRCYNISDYQTAIFKMRGFFYFLQPKLIFSSFRGIPSADAIEQLEKQAGINLKVGQKYMDAKLLATSMMLAFAMVTGGDAPMSLFTGDMPTSGVKCQQLQDFLPEPDLEDANVRKSIRKSVTTSQVFDILAAGRGDESLFDIKKSPIAAYLVGCLGDEGVKKILKDNQVNPMTSESARAFLHALPTKVVLKIASGIQNVAISREKALRLLIEEFKTKFYAELEEQEILC
eukprot:CAMPEP_0194171362 /NCGR_PEP_ID=MMETSP0154-20130528/5953_1 /TAXON_ID=1049557 /ORGANISM="Thalassiothrix antarctica, Strain L6-D1" /LENGTH=489 /DNA_ID=CAMNT_0038883635 /DNA_START=6 /DNA_END=1475 /DNA_ORIENTATION=-